jgi:hypothetical protein
MRLPAFVSGHCGNRTTLETRVKGQFYLYCSANLGLNADKFSADKPPGVCAWGPLRRRGGSIARMLARTFKYSARRAYVNCSGNGSASDVWATSAHHRRARAARGRDRFAS